MDNDKKRGGADAGAGESDNTIRARNRTIMLTPEMTGHVRARLVTPSSSVTTPLLAGGEEMEDSDTPQPSFRSGGWQPAPPPEWNGSQSGGSSGEDDNDWTRPIGVGEAEVESGGFEASSDAPEDQWTKSSPPPAAAPPYREEPVQEARPAQTTALPTSRSSAPIRSAPSVDKDGDFVIWRSSTALCGFLVTFDHNDMGDYIELRSGRLIVTSEEEGNGNLLCIRDQSVSPMHAIMRVTAGSELQVLDQLSESGTKVFRLGSDEEEFLSGEKAALKHGDVVVFGDRKYHVCLLIGR
jgi:FHA domain